MQSLITTDDLAERCGVPVATIYAWNHKGTGPRRIRIGKHVRYRPEDVEAWLERQADQPSAGRLG